MILIKLQYRRKQYL